jgi:hypothetical protein
MAFPDDYKRVQQPGAAKAIVEATIYLARQLAVNTSDWTLLVGDGSTPGGFRVLMESQFNSFMQLNAPFGTKAYIEAGTDGLPTELGRIWKASELYATFAKIVDTTTPSAWFIKDSAMPDALRAYSKSLSDANNALVSGFYRFDPATAANMPAGIPSSGPWHVMIVNALSAQNVGQVLFLRDGSGKIFTRSFTDGVWQAWIQATGVTLADLNTKVNKAGDTMTGPLILKAGNAASAPIRTPDGVAPTTPADGDIWREDASGGLRFKKGANLISILDSQNSAYAILQDQKNASNGGGASVAGSFITRDLNTEVYDPWGLVTLASNQFTLAFDCMIDWIMPFFSSEYNYSRVFNVTDGVEVIRGTVGYAEPSSLVGSFSNGYGFLTAGKTYALQYRVTTAKSSNGLGAGNAALGTSVYTNVLLRRVG